MSISYCLRIDLQTTTKKLVKQMVKNWSPTSYIYSIEQEQDNPHMHWYIETRTKPATMRSHIRQLGLQGNKSYSLTICKDKLKYQAYVIKDNYYRHSPDINIQEIQAYDAQVKTEMKERKTKKLKIVPTLLELTSSIPLNSKEKYVSDHVKTVITYHIENELPYNSYKIQTLTQMLLNKKNDYFLHLFTENISTQILKKLT